MTVVFMSSSAASLDIVFTHSSLAQLQLFPRGVGAGGREVGNPLLSRTLQIRTLEIANREEDRNILSAYTGPSSTLCDPGVICRVVTSAETPL